MISPNPPSRKVVFESSKEDIPAQAALDLSVTLASRLGVKVSQPEAAGKNLVCRIHDDGDETREDLISVTQHFPAKLLRLKECCCCCEHLELWHQTQHQLEPQRIWPGRANLPELAAHGQMFGRAVGLRLMPSQRWGLFSGAERSGGQASSR